MAYDDVEMDDIAASMLGDDLLDTEDTGRPDEVEAAPGDAEVVADLDGPQPMDDDAIENAVRQFIDNCVEFSESELSQPRINAQSYYNGNSSLGSEEGRSQVVVSRVRDTLRALMPAIMRVFMQTDNVVEFKARTADDVELAKAASNFCNVVFEQRNNGYRALYEAALDSLMKKVGVIKVWHDDEPLRVTRHHDDLDEEAYEKIATDESIEIIEQTEDEDGLMSITTMQQFPQKQMKFKTLNPEDFHVNREATCPEDTLIMCHRENKRVSEMVAMGFDYDDVQGEGYEENSTTDIEDDYRRGYVARDNDDTQVAQDPSSKEVLVTDTYCYLDADGDGIAELRHFITVGSYHKILFEEVVDEMPFAIFYSEIEPHAFYPRCLADMLQDDQDAATSLLRGVLDNVQLSNSPQRSVNENFVNLEDAMNAEIGAIIRVKQPGMIQDHAVPFIGAQTIGVMEYLDKVAESRSGVTQQAAGLHPDVMQSTTKAAVSATVNASQAAAELIARNLAETGMAALFKMILRMAIKNGADPVQMQQGGGFSKLDPKLWHSQMDLQVNVGLGTGQAEEKMGVLMGTAAKQEEIIKQMGMNNPFVPWQALRKSYVEMMHIGGFRDAETYFPEPTPEAMQKWQEEQKAKSEKGDPQVEAFVSMEKAKTEAKLQIDGAKLQGDMKKKAADVQTDVMMARMEDDRERDKQAQDFYLKEAELRARYNADVRKAALDAEVERQRIYESTINGTNSTN